MIVKNLIWERDGAFYIALKKYVGHEDHYELVYGQQAWKGDREFISKKLGEALFHCLECEGLVD